LARIEVREGWKESVVAMRPERGLRRFLMAVRKEACPACGSGVRTVSIWSTLQELAEEVAWCAHCFNATCRRVPLEPAERQRCHSLRVAVRDNPAATCWKAVRPALEDLERRGLL
jgi:hypothetical protein